jgi:glycosidase
MRRSGRRAAPLAALLVALTPALAQAQPAAARAQANFAARLPQDEIVYFLLPDRFANGARANDHGGFPADRLASGHDPAHKGFYHGGDLAGLIDKLDYIQGLGATALWLAPVFRNKPVQGPPGRETAGYHGYWIVDFTDIDPHFGTRADFKRLVDAAHARGLKVYLDIVLNHTADVIQSRECPPDCGYRSRADYPYQRKGGPSGPPINPGFAGEGDSTAANFARLTRPDYAYTPYVPSAEAGVKKPAWLNDPRYYHNRGESRFSGESMLHGDFAGLDDLFTENPRVRAGLIEAYGRWIDDFGIDGFRIDTVRHVEPGFWQAFLPAMLARAKAAGRPNFHIFGEVADSDTALNARHTRVDGFPSVLDFPLQAAIAETVANGAPTERLARLFASDVIYGQAPETAAQLATFTGNHDMGRFAHQVLAANPQIGAAQLKERVALAYAMILLSRGVPVIYYGDEQGFVGAGGDQDARQDMFASQVATYNAAPMADGRPGGSRDRFETDAPLYREISGLAALRRQSSQLRRGQQVVRASGDAPGLFAFSRLDAHGEVLAAFNTSDAPVTAQVSVEAASSTWRSLHGACAPSSSAPGSLRVELAPRQYLVCVSEKSR